MPKYKVEEEGRTRYFEDERDIQKFLKMPGVKLYEKSAGRYTLIWSGIKEAS